MFSYIDETYRAALLAAVDEYKRLKPRKRQADIEACLVIIRASYHAHADLKKALVDYFNNIRTGFNMFGMRVHTGRSVFKDLIMHALDSKTAEQLVCYEKEKFKEFITRNAGQSCESLSLDRAGLRTELDHADEKMHNMQAKLEEMEMRCRMFAQEKKSMSDQWADLMKEHEALAMENVQLQQKIAALNAKNDRLLKEFSPKKAGAVTQDHAASTTQETRFYSFYGGTP